MKFVRIVAASGAVLSLSILVALGMHTYFQDNTQVQFDPTAGLPTVLLPAHDKIPGHGSRQLDGKGGAVDTYQLETGFVLEIHVRDLIADTKDRELTFYPPRPDRTEDRGPLFSEKIYARNGRGLLADNRYDPYHHLIHSGKLVQVEKNWFYKVDEFNSAGIEVKAQLLKLGGEVENESSFRDNGTRLQTKKGGYGDYNWELTNFAEDGVKIVDQELRSYGRYRVIEYYEDGVTKKVDSLRGPGNVRLDLFNRDGSPSFTVQILDGYRKEFIYYYPNGKRKLSLMWYRPYEGRTDAKDLEPVWRLRDVNEYDEGGESTRTVRINEDGTLDKVITFKSTANPMRIDVEYKNGKPVKLTRTHEDTNVLDETVNPGDVPSVDIPDQWLKMPDYPAPRADKINVDSETPHDHGM